MVSVNMLPAFPFYFFLIISVYLILTRIIFYTCRKSGNAHFLSLLGGNENKNSVSHDTLSKKHTFGNIRALFVTAHPDDECMFFAPAILRLLELNASVRLLCLSSGNYYNQGNWRQKELLASCDVLGIPASQVTIVDNKELPDNPKVEWNIHQVSSFILEHITASSVNLVLTFDGRGVSGHANHIALYRAISYLASVGNIPDDCCFLALQSISVVRKYLSLLELPISWLFPSDFSTVIGLKEYKQAKRAMFCHRSQLLWFRHLYVLFSRYMLINTFRVVYQEKKEL